MVSRFESRRSQRIFGFIKMKKIYKKLGLLFFNISLQSKRLSDYCHYVSGSFYYKGKDT